MALGPGTRLGPYEIVGAIGAGGMGEVYRATDTRLGRTVAIKVLPEHLAADTERRQRLAREGRIVSSLEHSNICALYDIGHEAGHDFLVMQYLEGETLAERLKKGPFPADRALACAIDIAHALVAAHRLGVVHRDLKPGNVMLTKAGVKVLDFGLARLTAAVVTGSNAAANDAVTLPTRTDSHPITENGMMLGTLPYMAPEQVEGKPADARTDIFALGAVTYEMLTGRRAFHVVRKCLAKDPDARWQTAAGIVFGHRAELHTRLMVFALTPLAFESLLHSTPWWLRPRSHSSRQLAAQVAGVPRPTARRSDLRITVGDTSRSKP